MKKVLLIILIVIVLIVVGLFGFGWWMTNSAEKIIAQTYDVEGMMVDVPTDSASIARGQHIAITRGCTGCHGANLAGEPLDMGPIGMFYPSNLTPGEGGISGYSVADWERIIRHGVYPDGSQAHMMPSDEYYYLSDDDLGCLLAYLQTVEPVNRTHPPSEIGPVGKVMVALGQMPTLTPAKCIDHDGPRPVAPEQGVTVAYGEYLTVNCTGCHGQSLAGGVNLGPNAPLSTNLTPGGMQDYDRDAFFTAMRAGLKPDGSAIDPFMPFEQFASMTDDELDAIWLYLQSVPSVENEF